MESDPVEAVLLSNSPGLTHILLIEVTGEEDMVGLHIYGVNEEVIVMVLSQGDMFMFPICSVILHVEVPTKLASGEEQNIKQGMIEGVKYQRCTVEGGQSCNTG